MKSIPSMSLKTKAMKSLGRKILCVLLSGVFFGDTIAWAEAPILPDTTAPGNRYPLVQETANGIPLVNISAPTAGGVSRNDYERFNITCQRGYSEQLLYPIQNGTGRLRARQCQYGTRSGENHCEPSDQRKSYDDEWVSGSSRP